MAVFIPIFGEKAGTSRRGGTDTTVVVIRLTTRVLLPRRAVGKEVLCLVVAETGAIPQPQLQKIEARNGGRLERTNRERDYTNMFIQHFCIE